jgi:hypothetical protein
LNSIRSENSLLRIPCLETFIPWRWKNDIMNGRMTCLLRALRRREGAQASAQTQGEEIDEC